MNSRLSIEKIKAEALSLGFSACGVVKAETVDQQHTDIFMQHLNNDCFADMEYMKRNVEKRLNPELLINDGKESSKHKIYIISVALNYTPQERINKPEYQIASYAYGKDYHKVMKKKLKQLAGILELSNYRTFCDTAPILERYWAQKAGVGFICKNHQLIVPGIGSRCFLGEILFENIDSQLDTTNNICEIQHTTCDSECQLCINSCPMKNLRQDKLFDSRQCLSYQTIENKGGISTNAAENIGNNIYGCDACLDACPWNNSAPITKEEQFYPSAELMQMKQKNWYNLTEEKFIQLFHDSAIKRVKYQGLMRNIQAVKSS